MVRGKEGLSQKEIEEHLEGLKTLNGKVSYLDGALKRKGLLSPSTIKSIGRLREKLISQDPVVIAERYEKIGMKIKAAEVYESAGELYSAGEIWEEKGDLSKAFNFYERGLNSNTENWEREHVVEIAKKLGKIDEAIGILKDGKDFGRAARLAEKYDRLDEAIDLYEKDKKNMNDRNIAPLLEKLGKIDEAIELYRKMMSPGRAVSLVNRAAELAEEYGQINKAIEIYVDNNEVMLAANVMKKNKGANEAIKFLETKDYNKHDIAKFAEENGKISKAIELYGSLVGDDYFNHAIHLAKKRGMVSKMVKLYEDRGDFYEGKNSPLKAKDMRKKAEELRSSQSLEKKLTGIFAVGGIGSSLLFLSSNITGNAIGTLNSSTSNGAGVVFLLIGFVASFLYFRRR